MLSRRHPIEVVLAVVAMTVWMAGTAALAESPTIAPAPDDGITAGGPADLIQMSMARSPGQHVRVIAAQPLYMMPARPVYRTAPATQPAGEMKPMSAAAYSARADVDTNYFRAEGPNQAAAAPGDPSANLLLAPPNPYLAPDPGSLPPDAGSSYVGPYDDSCYDNQTSYPPDYSYSYPDNGYPYDYYPYDYYPYYGGYPYVYVYPQYGGHSRGGRGYRRFGGFYDRGFHGGLSGSGHFNGFQSGGSRGGGGFRGGAVQSGAMRGGGGGFHGGGGRGGGGRR